MAAAVDAQQLLQPLVCMGWQPPMEEKNTNAECPLTAAEHRCKSHLSHAFFKIARLSLRQQEGMLHRAWETGINKKPPQLKAKRERGCSNKFKRIKLSRDGKEQARPSTSQTWGRNPYVLHLIFFFHRGYSLIFPFLDYITLKPY